MPLILRPKAGVTVQTIIYLGPCISMFIYGGPFHLYLCIPHRFLLGRCQFWHCTTFSETVSPHNQMFRFRCEQPQCTIFISFKLSNLWVLMTKKSVLITFCIKLRVYCITTVLIKLQKGHIISKTNFGVLNFPKKTQKFLKDFCPSL